MIYRTIFLIIRKFIYIWVRSKTIPENSIFNNKLDPTKPICYIFRSRSWLDLLVLDYHCEKLGLPRPFSDDQWPFSKKTMQVIYLLKPGILQKYQSTNSVSLLHLILTSVFLEHKDIQLVPVSVFWGRNPGRKEKSLFRSLFFDDEAGGMFQKFVTLFVQGKNVVCHFANPIDLQLFAKEERDIKSASTKLTRVLRVHFKRQRLAIVGPSLYDRNRVLQAVISSKPVQELIQREAEKTKTSLAKVEQKAYRCLDEIAADMKFGVIRFLHISVQWLSNKLYSSVEVYNGERLHQYAKDYEFIYVPCHRSHMDYLLVGWSLYSLGFIPPHTAAGINLNFWPAGQFIRRGGGFFIRRSFSGDKIYPVVFAEYVRYLISEGYPMCFYIEGGRSRTGHFLPPKTGLLSMVLNNKSAQTRKKLAIVPIYIGYDKLMEGRAYFKELSSGGGKKSESLGQLVKIRKLLKSKYGKAYINYGEPIPLDDLVSDSSYVNNKLPAEAVSLVGQRVMEEIAKSSVLTPIALLSVVMLSAPKMALSQGDLYEVLEHFLQIVKQANYSKGTQICPKSSEETTEYALSLGILERYTHPDGDVFFIADNNKFVLHYYKNNVSHLFALPSLLCAFFLSDEIIRKDDLIFHSKKLYPLIQKDLFIYYEVSQIEEIILDHLKILMDLDILREVHVDGITHIARHSIMQQNYLSCKILGDVIFKMIESYALNTCMLANYEPNSLIPVTKFKDQCDALNRRISILKGFGSGDLLDKNQFSKYMDALKTNKFISFENTDTFKVCEDIQDLSKACEYFLQQEVHSTIRRSKHQL